MSKLIDALKCGGRNMAGTWLGVKLEVGRQYKAERVCVPSVRLTENLKSAFYYTTLERKKA